MLEAEQGHPERFPRRPVLRPTLQSMAGAWFPSTVASVTAQGPRWSRCVNNPATWSLLWVFSYLLFTHGWEMFYESRTFLTSSLPSWTHEGEFPGPGCQVSLGWDWRSTRTEAQLGLGCPWSLSTRQQGRRI